MTLKEYQSQTLRSCNDLGSEPLNLAHMVLGIFSEFNEFLAADVNEDVVNLKEEVADKFWYISNYCNFRGYDLQTIYNNRRDFIENEILGKTGGFIYSLSQLQDLVKKNLVYNKEINREIEEDLLKRILYFLEEWCYDINIPLTEESLEDILEKNINKLKARFPDKFTEENAINRNLEVERKILEA